MSFSYLFGKVCFGLRCFYKFFVVEKRSLKHHHSYIYPNISKSVMFHNLYQILDVQLIQNKMCRYCPKLFFFLIAAVFPGGSIKRKSNNDDKHGHGQEKRKPTTSS